MKQLIFKYWIFAMLMLTGAFQSVGEVLPKSSYSDDHSFSLNGLEKKDEGFVAYFSDSDHQKRNSHSNKSENSKRVIEEEQEEENERSSEEFLSQHVFYFEDGINLLSQLLHQECISISLRLANLSSLLTSNKRYISFSIFII